MCILTIILCGQLNDVSNVYWLGRPKRGSMNQFEDLRGKCDPKTSWGQGWTWCKTGQMWSFTHIIIDSLGGIVCWWEEDCLLIYVAKQAWRWVGDAWIIVFAYNWYKVIFRIWNLKHDSRALRGGVCVLQSWK